MGATLTENVVVSIVVAATLSISVTDAIGVADVPSVTVEAAVEHLNINVNDAVGVADVVTISIDAATTYEVAINDVAGIVEDVNISVVEASDYSISEIEAVSIAEDVNITVEVIGGFSPDINDGVSLTEDVTVSTVAASDRSISVVDTITLVEDVAISITVASDRDVSIVDSVEVAESLTVSLVAASNIDPSVYNGVSVAEVVTTYIVPPTLLSSVSDAVSVAESVTTSVIAASNISASVYDGISIAETVTISIVIGEASVSEIETVSIAESVSIYAFDPSTLSTETASLISWIEDGTISLTSTMEDGTINLNSTIPTPETVDRGVGDFNGSSSVIEISDDDLFSFGDGSTDSPFSISAWINMDDATMFTVIGKHYSAFNDETKAEWKFGTDSGDQLYFSIYQPAIGEASGIDRRTAALTSYEGEWIHVVGTYDGGGDQDTDMKIYINGVRADIDSSGGGSGYTATNNTSQPVEIGIYDTWVASYYANGKMHDVKIFNIELTQEQIETEYAGGNKTDDLVAYYKIYIDADDSSDNGLDGIGTDVTYIVVDSPVLRLNSLI